MDYVHFDDNDDNIQLDDDAHKLILNLFFVFV